VLTVAIRQAVADLAAGMLATMQMAAALGPPVRVAAGDCGEDPLPAANVVGGCLGFPLLASRDDGEADGPFHAVIERQLGLAGCAGVLARIPHTAWPEVEAQARSVEASDFTGLCRRVLVASRDGIPVYAYVAGAPGAPPVLLSAPCGMPARLVEPWVRHLSERAYVMTWESRGMFADMDAFDGATGVRAQVNDALAVVQALDLGSVHVAGLCGGAVVAAELAAVAPARVRSVSLWHGDFNLGDAAPRTGHQRNLLGLMAMAAESPDAAAKIHRVMCQSMLGTVPDDLAAQLLYPYVTPRLLLRYCQLNGAIMRHDISATLPDVKAPVLVVTSRTDSTAHPGGSAEVARRLPDAELVVRDQGDHISLFRGEHGVMRLLDDFLGLPAPAERNRPVASSPGSPR
jgi:pimeloyl-ACP methyl ester carboxylesterase